MATDELCARAKRLGLHGLCARWSEVAHEDWVAQLIEIEDADRSRRSLERRLRRAKLGPFKPLADFDWSWPSRLDKELVDDVLSLDFVREATNVILVGPNGVGKTTLAVNIGYRALLAGHTVLRVRASEITADLAMQDTSTALQRRLRRYTTPAVLIVDELGYLSYDHRHGDLLFEVVSRRHQQRPIVLTTNKPFAEWNEIFPNSSCVTALVDRLVHKAEIVVIDGESYRAKEAKERAAERTKARDERRKTKRRIS